MITAAARDMIKKLLLNESIRRPTSHFALLHAWFEDYRENLKFTYKQDQQKNLDALQNIVLFNK